MGGDPTFAVVTGGPGEEMLRPLRGDPFYVGVVPANTQPVPLMDARLLAPVLPRSKVLGIGRNYAAHAAEFGNEVPAEPMLFLMPNTAIVGPGEPIVLPAGSSEVHYEGELVVVIGRIGKGVSRDEALDCIFGYTCGNDVSARDWQRADGQWGRAKGFDTSCPIGPWIETDLDPASQQLTTRLDGRIVQQASTAALVHDVAALVAFASAAMTLLPGDLIFTGTPAGVGPIHPGQRVSVEIEGIGRLDNPVRGS